MLYMRRVSGNGHIRPSRIYSWPWIGSILVHSFYSHITLSEFFAFFHHLSIHMCINNYISNIFFYIYVYETTSTGSCSVSRSIDAEWLCSTLWGSQKKISRPHKHHAKGMGSLHQKTCRNHVNTMRSWIQTWLSGTNKYRTSTVISLNTMNIS